MHKSILLRDSTLREGLEVPQIALDDSAKAQVVELLVGLGVSAFELVGPATVERNLTLASLVSRDKALIKSAIVPLLSADRVKRLSRLLEFGINQVDLLLHVSEARLNSSFPADPGARIRRIVDDFERVLSEAKQTGIPSVCIGLGDAFRAQPTFLCILAKQLSDLKPDHIVLYDTVGIAIPSHVSRLIQELQKTVRIPLHCHFHNDLGMATANTIVAIESGAVGADVTIGGIGDRCGNACLEEVVLAAELRLGCSTGLKLSRLTEVSRAIRGIFGLPPAPSAPVVGDHAFAHSTASHYHAMLMESSEAYEPYSPQIVGQVRRFQIDDSAELALALQTWYARNGLSHVNVRSIIEHNRGRILTEAQLIEIAK